MIAERKLKMRNESKCSSCIHSEVCPHQTALTDAQKTAEETLSTTKFPFLKPISVECRFYSSKIMTRGDNSK